MNIYYIYFIGHYPVGAVAIIKAESKEQALAKFLGHLAIEEPELYESDNQRLTVAGVYEFTDECEILLNGQY